MVFDTKKNRFLLGILIIAIYCQGCASFREKIIFWRANNCLERFQIISGETANRSYPVSVDLVFVFDKTLIPLFEEVSAKEWFAKKRQFQMNYPSGFKEVSWEVVPGQNPGEKLFPIRHKKAFEVYVFANYSSSNQTNRAKLGSFHEVRLKLEEKRFSLKRQK